MKSILHSPALLFSGGLLLLIAGWFFSGQKFDEKILNEEKINLSLRRTAHHLLKQTGDSTTSIPPVERLRHGVWRVKLPRPFPYENLPVVLETSLSLYDIRLPYEVAVTACENTEVLLGYHWTDKVTTGDVPCSGRSEIPGCSYIQVTFPGAAAEKRRDYWYWTGWIMAGLMSFLFYRQWQKKQQTNAEKTSEHPAESQEKGIVFGQSRFDMEKQELLCGTKRHALTYREAKLLALFVQHPNEVLDRSHILKHVWADEGVIVSRSVDMFVSRLRKMLRDDPSVQLAAVHGIGYRLEV